MIFDDTTKAVIAQLAARMVEETVALGRQYGFTYPPEYRVGLKLIERGATVHVRLRLDDAEETFAVPATDAQALAQRLIRAASTVVHLWAERHPEYRPTRERARELVSVMGSAEWRETAITNAKAAVKAAGFRTEHGA